jgi:O-antigen/teichoic acid export membrane protein
VRWPGIGKHRARVEGHDPGFDPASDPGWPDVRRPTFWTDRAWWRRAGSTSIALWGSAAVSLLGTIVVARELGPSGYGSVVLAVGVVSLVATLLDLTLEQAVVHHGFRALAAQDISGLRTLLRIAFIVDLAIGLVVAGLVVSLAEPLTDLVSGGELDPALVRIAALITLASTVDGTTGAVLLLADRPDLRGWVMFTRSVIRLAGVILAVQVGGERDVVAAFAVAAACATIVQIVLAWRVGLRHWKSPIAKGGVREWLRKLMPFGIYSSLTSSVEGVHSSLIPAVLGSVSGVGTVGVFSVALFPVNLASLATAGLRLVLLPEQARQAAEGDLQGLRRTIRGATMIGLAIALPAAIAGWFLLPLLLPAIYSDQFEDAILPARILLIVSVIHLAVAWGKSFFPAIGRPGAQTALQAAFAILTVAGMALLARHHGSTGAAIAYTFTYAVTALPQWFLANRILGQERRLPPATGARGEAAPGEAGVPPLR